MADAPETPEASDPFSKRVALTIVLLAVLLALVSNKGDHAQSDSLLAATEAVNQGAYLQDQSIKEHSYQVQRELLETLDADSLDADKRQALLDRYQSEAARCKREKSKIEADVRRLQAEVKADRAVNDRCDLAAVCLQIGIVLGAVAILARWKPFWILSIACGIAGALLAYTQLPLPKLF